MATKEEIHAAFVAELLNEVPEDLRASVRASLENSKTLKDGVLRQSDYSRAQDELRAQREKVQGVYDEAVTKIDDWKKYTEEVAQDAAKAKESLAKYEAKFGPVDAALAGDVATGSYSKADLDRILAERGAALFNSSVDANDRLLDLKMKHQHDFGESIATKDLLKLANEKGVSVEIAYDILTAPKVAAKRDSEFKAAIEAAREEGRRDAGSGNLPFRTTNANHGMGNVASFINQKVNPTASDTVDRLDAATADINKRLAERGWA